MDRGDGCVVVKQGIAQSRYPGGDGHIGLVTLIGGDSQAILRISPVGRNGFLGNENLAAPRTVAAFRETGFPVGLRYSSVLDLDMLQSGGHIQFLGFAVCFLFKGQAGVPACMSGNRTSGLKRDCFGDSRCLYFLLITSFTCKKHVAGRMIFRPGRPGIIESMAQRRLIF